MMIVGVNSWSCTGVWQVRSDDEGIRDDSKTHGTRKARKREEEETAEHTTQRHHTVAVEFHSIHRSDPWYIAYHHHPFRMSHPPVKHSRDRLKKWPRTHFNHRHGDDAPPAPRSALSKLRSQSSISANLAAASVSSAVSGLMFFVFAAAADGFFAFVVPALPLPGFLLVVVLDPLTAAREPAPARPLPLPPPRLLFALSVCAGCGATFSSPEPFSRRGAVARVVR